MVCCERAAVYIVIYTLWCAVSGAAVYISYIHIVVCCERAAVYIVIYTLWCAVSVRLFI